MRRTVGILAAALLGAALAVAPGVAGAAPGGAPAIPLNPEQETPPAVSDGSGFFSYTVDGDELCYTLEVRDLTAAPVAAHIHVGPRNVAGPIVIGLTTPPAATSTVSACLTAAEGGEMTPAELAALVDDPRAHYVNVHTPMFPGGEVRGQLK
ncbi:MAG: CHRD domain-containing protein [Streptosporangiales bacterium]|nr:CHRD domain-containing protein [Streptosporangiales bacterium]